jgi:hypothetical protein
MVQNWTLNSILILTASPIRMKQIFLLLALLDSIKLMWLTTLDGRRNLTFKCTKILDTRTGLLTRTEGENDGMSTVAAGELGLIQSRRASNTKWVTARWMIEANPIEAGRNERPAHESPMRSSPSNFDPIPSCFLPSPSHHPLLPVSPRPSHPSPSPLR